MDPRKARFDSGLEISIETFLTCLRLPYLSSETPEAYQVPSTYLYKFSVTQKGTPIKTDMLVAIWTPITHKLILGEKHQLKLF